MSGDNWLELGIFVALFGMMSIDRICDMLEERARYRSTTPHGPRSDDDE